MKPKRFPVYIATRISDQMKAKIEAKARQRKMSEGEILREALAYYFDIPANQLRSVEKATEKLRDTAVASLETILETLPSR